MYDSKFLTVSDSDLCCCSFYMGRRVLERHVGTLKNGYTSNE